MATIKLIRKWVSIPDEGLSLQVVFEDQGNPLIDEAGGTILTATADETGAPVPAYPEFVVLVPIPADITVDYGNIEKLIAICETSASEKAQARADTLAIKTALIPILNSINGGT